MDLRMSGQVPTDRLLPNLAHDSAPQGSIQIRNEPFFGRRRKQQLHQKRRQPFGVSRSVRYPGQQLGFEVETLRQRRNLQQTLPVDHGEVRLPDGPQGKLVQRSTEPQFRFAKFAGWSME